MYRKLDRDPIEIDGTAGQNKLTNFKTNLDLSNLDFDQGHHSLNLQISLKPLVYAHIFSEIHIVGNTCGNTDSFKDLPPPE